MRILKLIISIIAFSIIAGALLVVIALEWPVFWVVSTSVLLISLLILLFLVIVNLCIQLGYGSDDVTVTFKRIGS